MSKYETMKDKGENIGILQTFKVAITERLQKAVIVDAGNLDEAEQIISNNWRNSEYVLGAEDFVDVEFEAVQADES